MLDDPLDLIVGVASLLQLSPAELVTREDVVDVVRLGGVDAWIEDRQQRKVSA
jgi:hypothetical protein